MGSAHNQSACPFFLCKTLDKFHGVVLYNYIKEERLIFKNLKTKLVTWLASAACAFSIFGVGAMNGFGVNTANAETSGSGNTSVTPSGWKSSWNYSNCPVFWGYKG
jgi:hypothetical protein